MDHSIIASVDLGSNSFRLQICKHQNGQIQVIDSIKEMVQLAAGLDDKKHLSGEAQKRALACLSRFGERLRPLQAHQVRAVATNTFRIMKGAEKFTQEAEAALGFPIEVIAGREEARLIYTGVVHTVPFNGKQALVVDIGGGSTEFIVGHALQPIITESLPLGCVSYSQRFFADGKVTPANFRRAVQTAESEIQRIFPELKKAGWQLAIGSSGSARSIRDVIAAENPPQDFISSDKLTRLARRLIRAGGVENAQFKGLNPDRIAVFPGSLAVMRAVFEVLEIQEMRVTDAALRDGVFFDLIGRNLQQDTRFETVKQFIKRYRADLDQALRVADVAECFFAPFATQCAPMQQQFVRWAAELHEIGQSITYMGYHKHSAYILEYADMPGFSRNEQRTLATLVLGHRGDLKKMRDFLRDSTHLTSILALRLAVVFCRARRHVLLPEFSLQKEGKNQFKLIFPTEWLKKNPLTANSLEQESEAWKKVDIRLSIEQKGAR